MFGLASVLVAAAVGCDSGSKPEPGPTTSPTASITPVDLTLGVWGTEEETAAYQDVVDIYNTLTDEATVEIAAYPDHDSLVADLDAGNVPDVFMVARGDLSKLQKQELTRPIGGLLDDRGVEFGDDYSRAALEAFASDRDLQCMPYGISPMVIFYNEELVDFELMAERGLDVPTSEEHERWTYDEFSAAAEFASRPRRGIAGFYVAPTLRGLAPFINSGGGQMFDDDEAPTSLAFSSDETRSALEDVLPLLRDPKLTLSEEQLAEASAQTRFERGELGMLAGFRSLVPELRQAQGLEFDVMPMPTVDDQATIGDISGLCIAADAADVGEAADLLVYLTSTESVRRVVRAGYLVPANATVALSDDFLQPGRQPVTSGVFNSSVRNMRLPPLVDDFAALEEAVADPLQQLMTVPVPDLDLLTEQIDEASVPVLSPEEASESPD